MELSDLIIEIQKYVASRGLEETETTIEELLTVMLNEDMNS
jgi:hypothetical protein